MLYRILTEDINRREIVRIVARNYDAFTVTPGERYWQGYTESSLVIEIEVPNGPRALEHLERVQRIAREIKELNEQEAVMVQRFEVSAQLI